MRFERGVGRDRSLEAAQMSNHYRSLLRIADENQDGNVSQYELSQLSEQFFHGLHHGAHGVPQMLRRLIVRHSSEWLDDQQWMNQVAAFSDGKPVWHFHPLEFLEMISSKMGCACHRDITLEELCQIAPKAQRATLEQYLSAFNGGFREFNMLTCREKAHFLAQCCHESGGLRLTAEVGGGQKIMHHGME